MLIKIVAMMIAMLCFLNLKLLVVKLPTPLKNNSDDKTTAIEYVGCPSNNTNFCISTNSIIIKPIPSAEKYAINRSMLDFAVLCPVVNRGAIINMA